MNKEKKKIKKAIIEGRREFLKGGIDKSKSPHGKDIKEVLDVRIKVINSWANKGKRRGKGSSNNNKRSNSKNNGSNNNSKWRK